MIQTVAELNAQHGASIRLTCDAAPVQYEGKIGDNFVYFRSRFDDWRIGIGKTEKAAIEADFTLSDDDPDCLYYATAEIEGNFDGSWLPHAEAERIICKHVLQFLNTWKGDQ